MGDGDVGDSETNTRSRRRAGESIWSSRPWTRAASSIPTRLPQVKWGPLCLWNGLWSTLLYSTRSLPTNTYERVDAEPLVRLLL